MDRSRIGMNFENCDVCQDKTASVSYSHLVGGKLKKVQLCEECAKGKGVTDPTGYGMDENLEGVGKETATGKPEVPGELVCGHCGFTHTDFKKTGRFGCAECYEVFDEGLDGLLEAMHKHTAHSGKVPTCVTTRPKSPKTKAVGEEKSATLEKEPSSSADKLKVLQESLAASVEAEDYEEAARLRDAISQMESQIGE